MSKINFRVLYEPTDMPELRDQKKSSEEVNPIFHKELEEVFIGALVSGKNTDSFVQNLPQEGEPKSAIPPDPSLSTLEQRVPQDLQSEEDLKVVIVLDPTQSVERGPDSVFNAEDYDEIHQRLCKSESPEKENGAEEEKVDPESVEEDLNETVDFLANFKSTKASKRKRPEDALRNNVLYKAVFRDFRKFVLSDFEGFFKRYLPILQTQVNFVPRYKKKYCQMKQHYRKVVLPILVEQYVEEGESPLFKDLKPQLNDKRKKMMIHVLAAIISLKDYHASRLGKEGKKWKTGVRLCKSMKVSKSKNSSHTSKNINEIVKSIEQVLRVFAQQMIPEFMDIPFMKNFLRVYTQNAEERVHAHKAMKKLPEKYICILKSIHKYCK